MTRLEQLKPPHTKPQSNIDTMQNQEHTRELTAYSLEELRTVAKIQYALANRQDVKERLEKKLGRKKALRKTPLCGLPVLELLHGTTIDESCEETREIDMEQLRQHYLLNPSSLPSDILDIEFTEEVNALVDLISEDDELTREFGSIDKILPQIALLRAQALEELKPQSLAEDCEEAYELEEIITLTTQKANPHKDNLVQDIESPSTLDDILPENTDTMDHPVASKQSVAPKMMLFAAAACSVIGVIYLFMM